MLNKGIERQINQIYNSIYKKVFNKTRTNMLASGSRLDIEQALIDLKSHKKFQEFAEKFSKELAKKGLSGQRGIWKKYYEAAKKSRYVALPTTYNQFELEQLSKAVKHNFEMINSIPDRMMEVLNHKYTSTLMEEVAKGTLPRGSFRRELSKHGHKQAKVIARTETAKLQTAITENRAKSVGSVAYIWLSSKDKRTRPSHREMNGVVVFWREDLQQPLLDNMRGNAGCFPNCRCDAQPIVDINDLTQSNYKVYDYRNDKVINLTKKQLIQALNKGEL